MSAETCPCAGTFKKMPGADAEKNRRKRFGQAAIYLRALAPRIYLPSDMEDTWQRYILAREQSHLSRKDAGPLIICTII